MSCIGVSCWFWRGLSSIAVMRRRHPSFDIGFIIILTTVRHRTSTPPLLPATSSISKSGNSSSALIPCSPSRNNTFTRFFQLLLLRENIRIEIRSSQSSHLSPAQLAIVFFAAAVCPMCFTQIVREGQSRVSPGLEVQSSVKLTGWRTALGAFQEVGGHRDAFAEFAGLAECEA